jgi:hypothetical protein
MNISLDNLYHWIRGCAFEPVSIYTFSPHGSKNITDLFLFESVDANSILPEVVCHDQEPLNFDTYQNVDLFDLWQQFQKTKKISYIRDEVQSLVPYYRNFNFYAMLRLLKSRSIFDRYILLHSEKNSIDVEKFSLTAEPVYYWSHGIIARDWYRFAEHDPRLTCLPVHKKTFLMYCRAWTGTREYRLKFLDMLIDDNLLVHCQTSLLHQDHDVKLNSYRFSNTELQPKNIHRLLSIPENHQLSHSSADYCAEDFVSTDISIILETVADSTKIHLTEKTLRPIACGHPFMLLAGPGSLDYLRSYGFKTFSPWINENYDLETNIVKRMQMITSEMQRIESLSPQNKQKFLHQLQSIATYNKNYFFSKKFFDKIHNELVNNLTLAINRVKKTRGRHYLSTKIVTKKFKTAKQKPTRKLQEQALAKILRQLRKDPTTSIAQMVSQFPDGFFNF